MKIPSALAKFISDGNLGPKLEVEITFLMEILLETSTIILKSAAVKSLLIYVH